MVDFLKRAKKANRITLDTSVYIYAASKDSPYSSLSQKILKELENKEKPIYLSTLLLTEFFIHPFRDQLYTSIENWKTYFLHTEHIHILPVSSSIAILAAQLRSTFNFSTPDSIYLATAIDSGSSIFICNDAKLKRFEEIEIICLSDYIDKK